MASRIRHNLYIISTSSAWQCEKRHIVINYSWYLAKQNNCYMPVHKKRLPVGSVRLAPPRAAKWKQNHSACNLLKSHLPICCSLCLCIYINVTIPCCTELYVSIMVSLFMYTPCLMLGVSSYDTIDVALVAEVVSCLHGAILWLRTRLW